MPQSEGYGERFAQAWRERGLDEIEAWDLEDLERLGQAETLAFLRKQPGLGTAAALDHAEEKEAASLARELARERAGAKSAEVPVAEQSWGARFLRAYVEEGGTFSEFSYAEARALKEGTPGEVAACLRDKFGVDPGVTRLEPGQAAASIRAS